MTKKEALAEYFSNRKLTGNERFRKHLIKKGKYPTDKWITNTLIKAGYKIIKEEEWSK